MRTILALFTAAGLCTASAAIQPPAPAPAPVAQPEAPKPIPVPDGPVVNRMELDGGLVVEDLKVGDGYEVREGDALVAHYHGTLKSNGNKFDSSYEKGEPAVFALGSMITGFQKGFPGMKVGGIRRLTIPAGMGYAERGAGSVIPPNSDLVFIVQVVDALQVEDLKVGDGTAAMASCVAVTSQTIKDKDGKDIEKNDAAHPYIWVPGEMFIPQAQMDAMQVALTGMKIGGKRRVTIPKEMNMSPPQAEVKRPQNVPLTIEMELLAVRNLGGHR